MLAPGLTLHPCGTFLEKDVQACEVFPHRPVRAVQSEARTLSKPGSSLFKYDLVMSRAFTLVVLLKFTQRPHLS